MKTTLKIAALAIVSTILTISCKDDLDDVIRPASNLEISEFIYRGLDYWSLYKADVPELADDFFENDGARRDFLDDFESPEATFDALLSPNDRFSVLRADYEEFENSLAGIRKSSGMQFSLFLDPIDNGSVFGIVRYVVNNSPAQDAGVLRGMIFTAIDGVSLTENTDFTTIFDLDAFTINLATFDEDSGFALTGESIDLIQVELSINPVHKVSTLDVEGNPVGYLHYTGFTNEFDSSLNAAFAQFQSAGVTDLILDLRYNGGGSVETANDLCSMITGQFQGEEFITLLYNEDRNAENTATRRFNSNLGSGDDGEGINSIGLTRVYVITTGRSASASELILSGLDPYIEIIQVGTNTVGKFEGSFLLYDAPAGAFSRAQANPSHRYVMLPLTFKSANANGLTDYFNGFTPDVEIAEDFRNYGTLGVPGEPLLDAVIEEIINGRQNVTRDPQREMNPLFETEQQDLLYQRMYLDPLK